MPKPSSRLVTLTGTGNDLSSRQWRLDTPTPFGQPGSILWNSAVFIKQMEFMSYSSQGNLAILCDRNGRVFWWATGAADLSPIRLGDIGWVDGVCLDTLDNAAGVVGVGGSICVIYIR